MGSTPTEHASGTSDPRVMVLLGEYREREADKRQVLQAIFAVTGVLVAAVVLATNASRDAESLPFALLAPLVLGATWLVLVLRAFAIRIMTRASALERELIEYLPSRSSFESDFIAGINRPAESVHAVRFFAFVGWASGVPLAFFGVLAILHSRLLATLGALVPQAVAACYVVSTGAFLYLGVAAWRKTADDLQRRTP